jgi:KDO2-lipid IV(A) lauroyltransferase
VGNTILWQTRDRLLDGRSDANAAAVFEVTGRDHLDQACGSGQGAIMLCNHFGAHMMPAHWLVRHGYPLRLFMERPRSISKYLAQNFDTEGPTGQKKLFISRKANPAESAGSILRACRVIRSGALLFIAGDVRWQGQLSAEAHFLGRTYAISCTWVTLAALTGAPVVTEFCVIRPDGSYLLEFLEPYTIPRDAEHPDQAGPWVQRYLDLVEERVRLYPSNSNDYFFWEEPEAAA